MSRSYNMGFFNNHVDTVLQFLLFTSSAGTSTIGMSSMGCDLIDVQWSLFKDVGISENDRNLETRADTCTFKNASWRCQSVTFARVSDCIVSGSTLFFNTCFGVSTRRNMLNGATQIQAGNCNLYQELGGTILNDSFGSTTNSTYLLFDNLQATFAGSVTGILTSSVAGIEIRRCPDVQIPITVTATGQSGDMKVNGTIVSYATLAAAPNQTVIFDSTVIRVGSP